MPNPRSYLLAELVETTGFDRRTIVYYIQSGLLPKVGRRGPHTRYPEECLTRLMFIKGVKALQTDGKLLTATLAEIRRALAVQDSAGIRALLDRDLPVDEVTALFSDDAGVNGAGMLLPTAAPAPITAAPAPQVPAVTLSPERVGSGVHGPSGERRSYGLADAGIRKRTPGDQPPEAVLAAEAHDETHPGLPLLDPARFQPAAPAAAGDGGAIDGDLGHLLRELEVRPSMNARRAPPGAPEQWTEIPITGRVYLSVRGLAEEDAPLAEAVARVLKRALRARPAAT